MALLLIAIGFAVGTIGTLIGVGGGFIVVPILLFLYPNADPAWISSVSMFVIAFNATSGSVVYLRAKRVHLRAAIAFVLAALPGTVIGVWAEHFINRRNFEMIFGLVLMAFAARLLLKKAKLSDTGHSATSQLPARIYWLGCGISFFVGFLASFFGIGGGVIHVPLMSQVLGFPVHLATGTSHAILALTSVFTVILHFINGDINISDPVMWELAIPAMIGAQIGGRLSSRVSGAWIMRLLGGALFLVGLRLLVVALHAH